MKLKEFLIDLCYQVSKRSEKNTSAANNISVLKEKAERLRKKTFLAQHDNKVVKILGVCLCGN